MQLLQSRLQTSTTSEIQEFSNWIVKVGDGKLCEPNDGVVDIEIPPQFLISDFNDPIEPIMSSKCPQLLQNYTDKNSLKTKTIIANNIETVDEINEYVLSLIPGNYIHILRTFINIHILYMSYQS